ncbi:hypothetical protein AB0A74_06970 [Saccharothrix sp. NPDC042600]|uniref:hypothetical protein n=1 Tax=Saccharothrix TaxID=2071 RepID=UPI003401DB55|nr:hypothetical protein GCM10017745_30850 [Saccharothrix mutabilis subsp. capreolus]
MSAPVPVPLDVAELVVRELRRLLSGRPEEVAAGALVATETGRGSDGGPPSLPWLLVAEDGHAWQWPAIQRATIRITCWHHTEHRAKALAGLALGLLSARPPQGAFISASPVTGPLLGIDPYTSRPLAFVACSVLARTRTMRVFP